MKMCRKLLMLLAFCLLSTNALAQTATCRGKWMNPITDICWSCLFPVSIGSYRLAVFDQTDMDNPSQFVCSCPGVPPRFGVNTGFWEPSHIGEVVRRPFCFPGMGGMKFGGFGAQHGRRSKNPNTPGQAEEAFYEAHYYVYPVIGLLGAMFDNPCITQGTFDLAYMTELDPTWNKPELSAIFNAEALLFANPITVAACAADCVASSTLGAASPLANKLFWCAGCQGSLYPQTGWNTHHNGGVDSSLLTLQRLMYKLHKSGVAPSYHSSTKPLCFPSFGPEIMNHAAYKTQMIYPTPNTKKVLGSCCQSFGATSITWRAFKEYPLGGEDFGYLLFKKRNCCLTY